MGRFRVIPQLGRNTRSSENLHVNALHQTSIRPLRTDERKSRCSWPTSNASLVCPGSDYAAHTASRTNLPSQQPPKTSENSFSSNRWDQPQGEPQAGYEQPNEINVVTSINGPKTTSFSTQSAHFVISFCAPYMHAAKNYRAC